MKIMMKRLIITVAACTSMQWALSQSSDNAAGAGKEKKKYDWQDRNNNPIYRSDSVTRDGYTLIFLVQDSTFSTVTQQQFTDAFFVVYPQEVERFNKAATKKIVFIIDPSYEGVAAASNGIIRCSPVWMKKHPEDIDVITHEAMHIVQNYHKGRTPGWLTEGIADYVRYKYGVNNDKGGWSLPAFKPAQHYTNAYRVTARFLAWLEENVEATIVDKLNKAAYDGKYKPELWKRYTGKTVDELWDQYAQIQQRPS
jgi:hypothetical protein